MAFRGVGKSWITTTFALWQLLLDPNFKVEVISASGGLSDDITKFALMLIKEMPLLEHLKPRRGQRESSLSFDVGPARPAKSPSMKSAGISGQITGTRADLIIPDDVEIPKNSFTFHLRNKLQEQTKEFAAILKPEDHARIVYLGTPQVEESLYPVLEQRGYKLLVIPAEIPEEKSLGNYQGRLAPFVQKMIDDGAQPGDPVDPERFPKTVLAAKKAEYGAAGYALQFMLDTSPASADKHPLKISDLIIHDVDDEIAPVKIAWGKSRDLRIEDLPAGGFAGDYFHKPAWISDEMADYGTTVMAIDPSGRGKDELAYAIIKELHSTLYVKAIGGFLDGFGEETLRALAAASARHGVHKVIAETNYGGGMFNELFKPYLAEHGKGTFDEDYNGWSSGQKEQRIIQTLEPVMQQHRLVIDRKIIEEDNKIHEKSETRHYSLIWQMTRMENIKGALPHDDRLEALAMGCGYFVQRMNQNRDLAIKASKEAAMDKEIEDFLRHALDQGEPSGTSYTAPYF